MFKYIKWELTSVFKKNTVVFLTILLVFLLEFMTIKYNTNSILITCAALVLFFYTFFKSFSAGTKRTLETFSKPTFLLESMIPISPAKLLLAKYIIAILLNCIYAFLFLVGMSLITEEPYLLSTIADLGKYIITSPLEFVLIFSSILCTSTAFTSTVTTIFLLIKSKFPNIKLIISISFIIGFVLFIYLIYFYSMINTTEWGEPFTIDLYLLAIILINYLISTFIIKNKLEIYN